MGGSELPTMLLTTTGRRTGKERTVPLNYVRDGKNLVAVCENFGMDTASSWPYNLIADPNARLEIDGTAANCLSRPATEDEVGPQYAEADRDVASHDTYVKRSGTRKVCRVFGRVDTLGVNPERQPVAATTGWRMAGS